MIGQHPIKQILIDTRVYWDHDRTPAHIRENFIKVIQCGTSALGAEVYASATESKLVFHTCKSKFCTSCGQRATEAWQQDLQTILPDIRYLGILLTMPMEFRPILQQNRRLLHLVPAMGAEAIMQWAKARYGVRLFVIVVQQTFGGFLNFSPHLHVIVSAGGLDQATNRWIHRIDFDKAGLMRAWRYALIAFLAEALKRNLIRSSLSSKELMTMFEVQYKRAWKVMISWWGSKANGLKHDGRYIRRPPIAQHRLKRIGPDHVEYLAKDTANARFAARIYTNKELVEILIRHAPDRGRHAMRYFGLLSPRSKAQLWAGVFVLLRQRVRQHPPKPRWQWLRLRTFGIDPLLDSRGQPMHWVGQRAPLQVA